MRNAEQGDVMVLLSEGGDRSILLGFTISHFVKLSKLSVRPISPLSLMLAWTSVATVDTVPHIKICHVER